MQKNYIFTAIISLGLLLSACDMGQKTASQATPPPQVAVLDIDLVAEKTGHKQKINETLQVLRGDLESELRGMQEKLRTQLEESKDKLGDKPSSEQQQELAQMLTKAQQEFQTLQKKASSSFKMQQAKLVKELRDKIRPIAMDIAKKRGIKIVLLRSDVLILAHDSSIDITNDVIDEVNKLAPVKPTMESTPAAAPSVVDMPAISEPAPAAEIPPAEDKAGK